MLAATGAVLLASEPSSPAVATNGLPDVTELWSVYVNYARAKSASDALRSAVTLRVKSKDHRWIVSHVESLGDTPEQKQPFVASYITCNNNDGDWWVHYNSKKLPVNNRIVLDDSLKITRLKKGKTLPSHEFEIGSSGPFEAGGIPFSYQSSAGYFGCEESGKSETAVVMLVYPKDIKLAMAEIWNKEGRRVAVATKDSRSEDRAETRIEWYDNNKPGERFSIRATLRDGEETFLFPVHREIVMGGEVGCSSEESTEETSPAGWVQKDVESLPLCPADVTLLSYWGISSWTLKLNIQSCDGKALTMGTAGKVMARDAEGRALPLSFGGDVRDNNEDGPLEITLYGKQTPQGGRLLLDTQLPLIRVTGKRTLPPIELPSDRDVSVELEGMRFEVGPSHFAADSSREDKAKTVREFQYPEDGRIASLKLQYADGSPVDICGSGGGSSSNERHSFLSYHYRVSPSSKPVQAVVTVYDGEPCRVTLKMKVGLSGRLDDGEQSDSSGKTTSSPANNEQTKN